MKAEELRQKARERLAEIASEREALAREERELRAMIGEAVSLVPTPPVFPFYDGANPPMVRPIPYDVRPLGPSDWPPGFKVTCDVIRSTTPRIGAEHDTPDEGIVYGAAS
jgi:hypothetical protein